MSAPSPYQLLAAASFAPTVGSIASMLEHSRASLLATVNGLSQQALDHQHDATANPIGALLAHIASVEWFYTTVSIDAVAPTGEEWATWGTYLRLSPAAWAAAKGQSLEQHVERLAGIRARTMAGLATKDDAWLAATFSLPWTTELANNHWAWYHVIEDELNHRGQIRWLKSRLPA